MTDWQRLVLRAAMAATGAGVFPLLMWYVPHFFLYLLVGLFLAFLGAAIWLILADMGL